jgi:hypothetical protein
MDTQVTLTIPDYMYRQVEAAARRLQRPVADLLLDVVAEAFPAVYVHPQRARMEEEQRSYERQREELVSKYEGQYIAMHGGQVVDSDPDMATLVQRINARFSLDEVVHIRQVTREPDRELRIFSPRFVD